jgi:uncharacterized protein
MLAVHVQLFAFPSLARWNPTVYGDFRGLDWWAWLVTAVLADGKFIAIFAMLLGASIVMQDATRAVHARRMAALVGLGLLHAHLVWYGDMLVPLGICGALAFPARRLAAGRLLGLGGAVFAAGSLIPWLLTWSTARADGAAVAAWAARWARPEAVAREIEIYRGSWADQLAHRVPAALETETWDLLSRLGWQMTGLVLIGMALFKLGVLTASRPAAFAARLAAVGFGAGIALDAAALGRSAATGRELLDFVLVSQPLHYWGNLLVALGWVGLLAWAGRRGWAPRALQAVGRTALSNYLLQSVIATTLFYGHGLGLFGRVDRAGQLALVAAVWIVELAVSSLWLSRFAVGPAEWLTRWITYGRRPGWRRRAPVLAGPAR